MSVKKTLLVRNMYEIVYREHYCANYECWNIGRGPTIEVVPVGWVVAIKCWHTKRLFGRNRTVTECVALAVQWVIEQEAATKRAQLESEVAAEEAEALSEFVTELLPRKMYDTTD